MMRVTVHTTKLSCIVTDHSMIYWNGHNSGVRAETVLISSRMLKYT
jgi:hypothetical protein